jgi:hypothetical protein
MLEPPLQPLRIPTGWTMAWNDFVELNPDPSAAPESDHWLYFHQDLLLLKNEQRSLLIDVGWYPDGNPTGKFRAVLLQHYEDIEMMRRSWDTPIKSAVSPSRQEIVAIIEQWLRTS